VKTPSHCLLCGLGIKPKGIRLIESLETPRIVCGKVRYTNWIDENVILLNIFEFYHQNTEGLAYSNNSFNFLVFYWVIYLFIFYFCAGACAAPFKHEFLAQSSGGGGGIRSTHAFNCLG
jgi:hypothetical protein